MDSLRDFVADVLESQGAVVDPIEPDGLDVLAPEPLRTAFGWPELARLGFGATVPRGAIPIGLEGDWLDRIGGLLGERGKLAERQLVAPANATPPSDPARLIDRALTLPNAVWRLKSESPAWTRCLLLAFRTSAISDEKREGLIWLGFNCGTGAVLDPDLLGRLRASLAHGSDWCTPEPDARQAAGPAWDAATICARVRPLIEHHVRQDLEPFLAAMRRRLDRDRGRVHEYHDDLRRAALAKLAMAKRTSAGKPEAHVERETMRVSTIEREYAAKLADLGHNYALRVTVEWVQGLVLLAPVHRNQLLIKRRKSERLVSIDWHPAARMLEPVVCDWGLGRDSTRLVCDERLHLTDASGQAPCASCGKPYCRACHPLACPRCRRA